MEPLKDTLQTLQDEALRRIESAADAIALESLRVEYLGRKEGRLTQILRSLAQLSADEKKAIGQQSNQVKGLLEEALTRKQESIEKEKIDLSLKTSLDLTLPATPWMRGKCHPLTQVMDDIVSVFTRLGFNIAEGPEVETDFNNFTALNHPPDHPARDSHDTFYVKDFKDGANVPLLMRTHTSPVQVRYMTTHKPPVYIVSPGRVFRHEAVDATHSYVFHQVEGLAIDTDISLADLKGVLSLFAKSLFGGDGGIRFRPSYFPFVEPGIEVDISCTLCQGKGCSVCKNTGWIEMLGAGLVNPKVLRTVGYDPEQVSGYAFGIGAERVAMFKYGINDIRLFYENDLRFLKQF
ncbi:MAG TPA: phenylalanine--tRNA ligase subunit alpha [Elusimicrobiota bacterium]|nr:phenylalanine--tRNA ligase subunit alpha [Elusimicrobiota bacterium]